MRNDLHQTQTNWNAVDTAIATPIQQGYRKFLHKKFSITNSYEEFMAEINNELAERFGVLDWAYSFLNLPDKLAIVENFGTVNCDYVAEYIEKKLFQHDLLLHHAKLQDTPTFQSDIINAVNSSNIHSYDNQHYRSLYTSNVKFGFKEIGCIPVVSPIDGGRCMFTVTSRNLISPKNFKCSILKNILSLTTLALAINDIGIRCYKNEFLKALANYKSLAYSQPLNLLATMGKYDLDTGEGAQRLGITYNTAKNHIAKIKMALGANTIHGAYNQAIIHGLIV